MYVCVFRCSVQINPANLLIIILLLSIQFQKSEHTNQIRNTYKY